MAGLPSLSLDYPTTKAIADTLARQLANPHCPSSCHLCLNFFMIALNGGLVEHIPRLRLECHKLFDACLAVLCVRHTTEQLEHMALRLAENPGRCRVHHSDSSVPVLSPDGHLHALFQSAAFILDATVHLGERSVAKRAIRAGKAFSDKHGRWPARVEQLFPHGVRATVDGLLANCELYVSEGPIFALGDMVDIARPLIMPVLASEPFRTRLVDIVLKMLDPAASGILQRAPWLTESRLSLKKTAYLLDAIMAGPGARPQEADNLFAGQEDKLLRTIASVIETMGDDDKLLESLSLWCIALTRHPDRAMPPRMQRWIDSQDGVDCKSHAADTLYQFFFALATSRACAGPGCTLSSLQNADGRAFSTCARCRTPRYCSPECQRADWKGKGGALIPHKTICRVFARFDAKACAKLELLDFAAVYARVEPDFDDADLDAIRALLESICARHHRDNAHPNAE